MIIFMSDILCVTNRKLCREDFLTRIEKVVAAHPARIILREKDLEEEAYFRLAGHVLNVCRSHQVPWCPSQFVDVAVRLEAEAIHMPLPALRDMTEGQKAHFKQIGASCHSVEDAREAVGLGCTYVTAGHVFATDCKMGLPGRGLSFLENVCESVTVPVYAIGGISSENIGAGSAAWEPREPV